MTAAPQKKTSSSSSTPATREAERACSTESGIVPWPTEGFSVVVANILLLICKGTPGASRRGNYTVPWRKQATTNDEEERIAVEQIRATIVFYFRLRKKSGGIAEMSLCDVIKRLRAPP